MRKRAASTSWLGERVLAFFDDARRAPDTDSLSRLFKREIARFGLDTYACGRLPSAERPTPAFFIMDWPPPYQDAYTELRMFERDPGLLEIGRGGGPASWAELRARNPKDFEDCEVVDIASDFGFTEGFIMPIREPGGDGCVGMAGEACSVDAPQARSALELMSHVLYQRAKELAEDNEAADQSPLTPREREVLQCIAAGCSDWEIGERLGVSRATAHFHAENAKSRLDSRTRAQAVALAVHRGWIDP